MVETENVYTKSGGIFIHELKEFMKDLPVINDDLSPKKVWIEIEGLPSNVIEISTIKDTGELLIKASVTGG